MNQDINRRTFLRALTASSIARSFPGIPNRNPVQGGNKRKNAPSKRDSTLYDRPGWCSHAWYHRVEADGTILVPIQSCDMRFPYGDFIRTETDDLVLSSSDNGRSWSTLQDLSLTAFPWGCYGLAGRTSSGTLISIVCADYFVPAEERKAHLERYGLSEFYTPHTEWLYRPWPIEMADTLRKQGMYVFSGDEGSGRMVFSLLNYCCRISRDNGKTWTRKPIKGLPFFSNEAGSFRNTIVTQKGVWLASVFGTPNPNRDPAPIDGFGSPKMPIGSYALRSKDQGTSWTLHPIGYDASGEHSFDETALLQLPSGRILAMLRHSGFTDPKQRDITLFQCHSDDDGETWSTPASS